MLEKAIRSKRERERKEKEEEKRKARIEGRGKGGKRKVIGLDCIITYIEGPDNL